MSTNQNQKRLLRAIDWEDARAVLDVCGTTQGSIVSVIGAGDIALSLLTKSFSSLTVIAFHETERMLFELKLRAVQSLHPDNVYNLLGIHPSGRRVFVYHQLRDNLSEEAKLWWDQHENFIREGVLKSGQQEKRHRRFQTWMKRLRLDVEKIPMNSIAKHKRWTVLDHIVLKMVGVRPHETFWVDDNPYAHMLLHQSWNVGLLQSGPLSLSYEGMHAIQRSKMGLQLITGSLSGWMETETFGDFSIVYLGSLSELSQTQTMDQNLWNRLSHLLSENGIVLCWSVKKPTSEILQWRRYQGVIRSAHSGLLWIGRVNY